MKTTNNRLIFSTLAFVVLIVFRLSDYFPNLFYPLTGSFWLLIISSLISVITLVYNMISGLVLCAKNDDSINQFLINLAMIVLILLMFWVLS